MITRTLRVVPDLYPIVDVRVIDGDTLEARILLPFDTSITKRIRLKGWWADELAGPYAADGAAARHRLACFVDGRALWLCAPSCRLDKFGRVIGTLMDGQRVVTAQEVLGDLQLTEAVHKDRSDAARACRRLARLPPWP